VAALAEANRTGVHRPAYRGESGATGRAATAVGVGSLGAHAHRNIDLLRSQVRATRTADGDRRRGTFSRRFAAIDLPAAEREALRPLTELLQGLAIPLRAAEAWAHQTAAADPVARRLMTGPAVGSVTRAELSRHARIASCRTCSMVRVIGMYFGFPRLSVRWSFSQPARNSSQSTRFAKCG
jgi:hypothetical protein